MAIESNINTIEQKIISVLAAEKCTVGEARAILFETAKRIEASPIMQISEEH